MPERPSDDPNVPEPAPRVSPGGGQGATWAILAFLLVGAVLVYLLGYGR